MSAAPATGNRLASLMTTVQLARLFKVSRVSVNNWRNNGCPCQLIPGDHRDVPRYVLYDVVEWRRSRGLKVPSWVKGQLSRTLAAAARPAPATSRRGSTRPRR